MNLRDPERAVADRIRLLEMEATLQRAELAATFERWQAPEALASGTTLPDWGFTLFVPRIRWLIVTSLFARRGDRRWR